MEKRKWVKTKYSEMTLSPEPVMPTKKAEYVIF